MFPWNKYSNLWFILYCNFIRAVIIIKKLSHTAPSYNRAILFSPLGLLYNCTQRKVFVSRDKTLSKIFNGEQRQQTRFFTRVDNEKSDHFPGSNNPALRYLEYATSWSMKKVLYFEAHNSGSRSNEQPPPRGAGFFSATIRLWNPMPKMQYLKVCSDSTSFKISLKIQNANIFNIGTTWKHNPLNSPMTTSHRSQAPPNLTNTNEYATSGLIWQSRTLQLHHYCN